LRDQAIGRDRRKKKRHGCQKSSISLPKHDTCSFIPVLDTVFLQQPDNEPDRMVAHSPMSERLERRNSHAIRQAT
jgi:hypothetical protein